jgi:hypothetical protein
MPNVSVIYKRQILKHTADTSQIQRGVNIYACVFGRSERARNQLMQLLNACSVRTRI